MKMWIGRDDYGLYLFEDKPYLVNDKSYSCDGFIVQISDDNFPEVTFENSPQKVELKLVEE